MPPGDAITATAALPAEGELLRRGWEELPDSYRFPEAVPSLQEARLYCRRLAESHYENFHVVTWFLPKALRPHFQAIYAYCRIADDLGDEVEDPAAALALLALWGRELDACYEGRARHPVFVALAETIRECAIPKEPFANLLRAFVQDQSVKRYASMQDVLGYCSFSANPVGRLVLYACGEADEERFLLSDATCCALQLANFWQDVYRDFAMGRIYLPQDDMKRFGVEEGTLAAGVATPEFRALIRHEVDFTRGLFEKGLALVDLVRSDLAVDLRLFSTGGLEILRAIERQRYDVLSSRPSLSKGSKLKLALRALAAKAQSLPWAGPRTGGRAA